MLGLPGGRVAARQFTFLEEVRWCAVSLLSALYFAGYLQRSRRASTV
jgi:hypothetical protein